VAFRLSLNNVYGDADDVAITATRSVAALAAGASSAGSTTITVPATTAPNTYYLCAKADSANTVAETDESNNTLCSSTLVTVPEPDLIVSALSTTATTGTAGGSISVSNSIKNQGGSKAGSSIVAFHLSTNATYGDGDDIVSITSRTISSLAINATSTVGSAVKIPLTTPSGTYYVCVRADDADSVAESDESNNAACTATAFTVP
jgi:subtilase family serine protease